MDLTGQIRAVLDDEARLGLPASELADLDNLYRRGLTSHASVSVMLALEDSFEVEFPDEMLQKQTFESIDAIRAALGRLGVADDRDAPALD